MVRDAKGRYAKKAGGKRIKLVIKKKPVEHKKKTKLTLTKRPKAKNAHKNQLERARYRRKHPGVRRRNCSNYFK